MAQGYGARTQDYKEYMKDHEYYEANKVLKGRRKTSKQMAEDIKKQNKLVGIGKWQSDLDKRVSQLTNGKYNNADKLVDDVVAGKYHNNRKTPKQRAEEIKKANNELTGIQKLLKKANLKDSKQDFIVNKDIEDKPWTPKLAKQMANDELSRIRKYDPEYNDDNFNEKENYYNPRDEVKYHLDKGDFDKAYKVMQDYDLLEEAEEFKEGMRTSGGRSEFGQYLKNKQETHYAGEELYNDDPNRYGDKMRKVNDFNKREEEASAKRVEQRYNSVIERYNKDEAFRNSLREENEKLMRDAKKDMDTYLKGGADTSRWENDDDFIDDLSREYDIEKAYLQAEFDNKKQTKWETQMDLIYNKGKNISDAGKTIEDYKKKKSISINSEKQNELKSLLRERINKDMKEFKKNNPGKSDYFIKNNYNATSIIDKFNKDYDTNLSGIMLEDNYGIPYVSIVDNSESNIKSIYNNLKKNGSVNSPAGNKIVMRNNVARRSNAYDWNNDKSTVFIMANGEKEFAKWIKEIDKIPVKIDRS